MKIATKFTIEIGASDLPKKLSQSHSEREASEFGPDLSTWPSADEIERRYVLKVYDAAKRNKSLAANILGYNRKTLYRKLHQYGLIKDKASMDAARDEAAADR